MRVGKMTDVHIGHNDAHIKRDQYYELHTLMFIYFQHIQKIQINRLNITYKMPSFHSFELITLQLPPNL